MIYVNIIIINIINIKMSTNDLYFLPYTATSVSIIGRLIFMFLLYKNKSINSLSLLFCILSISSSSMWLYYSIQTEDIPMITRSSTEISLLTISAIYIIKNKIETSREILPT